MHTMQLGADLAAFTAQERTGFWRGLAVTASLILCSVSCAAPGSQEPGATSPDAAVQTDAPEIPPNRSIPLPYNAKFEAPTLPSPFFAQTVGSNQPGINTTAGTLRVPCMGVAPQQGAEATLPLAPFETAVTNATAVRFAVNITRAAKGLEWFRVNYVDGQFIAFRTDGIWKNDKIISSETVDRTQMTVHLESGGPYGVLIRINQGPKLIDTPTDMKSLHFNCRNEYTSVASGQVEFDDVELYMP